jgi:hypothetical protein
MKSMIRFRRRLAPLIIGLAILAQGCASEPGSETATLPARILSPAPPVSGSLSSCPFGPPRASSIGGRSFVNVMQDHVPRWLPAGMGLVEAFGVSGDGARGGAYFADAHCREVELWFWKSGAVGSGHRLGAWLVHESQRGGCVNAVLGKAVCIDYRAPVPGGSIGVQTMGLSRSQGASIVVSIPL